MPRIARNAKFETSSARNVRTGNLRTKSRQGFRFRVPNYPPAKCHRIGEVEASRTPVKIYSGMSERDKLLLAKVSQSEAIGEIAESRQIENELIVFE